MWVSWGCELCYEHETIEAEDESFSALFLEVLQIANLPAVCDILTITQHRPMRPRNIRLHIATRKMLTYTVKFKSEDFGLFRRQGCMSRAGL